MKLATIVLAVLAAAAPALHAQDLRQGLVGYWKGDDLANPTVAADGLPGGTATGNYLGGMVPVSSPPPAPLLFPNSASFSFDGSNDVVEVPSFTWPVGGVPVTVAFWNYVATSDLGSRSAFQVGGSEDTNIFHAHVPYSDKTVYWDYGNHSSDGRISTSYAAHLDKWTHVALVSGGKAGNFKGIYLDGVLAASSNGSSNGPDIVLTKLLIGKRYNGYFHKGRMDDFRIYNRVLTAQEVAMLAGGQGSDAPSKPTLAAQKVTATSAIIPAGGSTTATGFTMTANVTDPGNRTVRLEAEVRPLGMAFTDSPTVTPGALVASGLQASVAVTGLTRGVYRWQIRTKNVDGLTSPWAPYGDDPLKADLFAGPNAAPSLASLGQVDSKSGRTIATGANLESKTLRITADVGDSDGDSSMLQAEVRPEGVPLSGESTHASEAGLGVLAIDVTADEGGSHWQVRAIDRYGATSAWVAHSSGEADYRLRALGSLGNAKVCSASPAGSSTGGIALLVLLAVAGMAKSRLV